ncbi:MAG TPA: hypothetical protein VG248_18350 [Caulobacteraceae bacterium]|jgi:hypothetical protein|nr:hypothetical protein [Caulobacteraceae bacterium]
MTLVKPVLLIALGAFALAGCAETPSGPMLAPTQQPPPILVAPPSSNFDPAQFAWSTRAGANSLQGLLQFRRGGARYTCAGGDVLLTPETPWSRRRMVILYGSAFAAAVPVSIVRARTPSAGAGDYARYVRRTTCDAQDHFSFEGLPDGAWYVITVGKAVDGSGEPLAITRRIETRGGARTVVLS